METVNATQFLRNDHKIVKGLFTQAEAAGLRAPEMKEGVLRELYMMLEIHTRIEEELFYPSLRERPETAALVEQGFDDHREAKELIGELKGIGAWDESHRNAFLELMATITTHVDTEESELFPLAERVLGASLEDLGARMQERKSQLMESPEYRDARPEVVQDPNGGEQIRKTA